MGNCSGVEDNGAIVVGLSHNGEDMLEVVSRIKGSLISPPLHR